MEAKMNYKAEGRLVLIVAASSNSATAHLCLQRLPPHAPAVNTQCAQPHYHGGTVRMQQRQWTEHVKRNTSSSIKPTHAEAFTGCIHSRVNGARESTPDRNSSRSPLINCINPDPLLQNLTCMTFKPHQHLRLLRGKHRTLHPQLLHCWGPHQAPRCETARLHGPCS